MHWICGCKKRGIDLFKKKKTKFKLKRFSVFAVDSGEKSKDKSKNIGLWCFLFSPQVMNNNVKCLAVYMRACVCVFFFPLTFNKMHHWNFIHDRRLYVYKYIYLLIIRFIFLLLNLLHDTRKRKKSVRKMRYFTKTIR